MNKNVAGILGAAAVLTMLAGCTAYDRTSDQFTQPVVKDVKKGMSRAHESWSLLKKVYPLPASPARGSCLLDRKSVV